MDQRQPMVLVVIAQKAQTFVAEHDAGREHGPVPLGHPVELAGAQHEMREFRGADRLGGRKHSEKGRKSFMLASVR